MINKKTNLICILLISCLGVFHAQMSFIPEALPTPNAKAINQAVFFPVSHYTGTADVNLPLLSLRSSQTEIPISMHYDASGVKLNSHPSMVGQNWNLSGIGAITRSVKGQPDEAGTYGMNPSVVLPYPYFFYVEDGLAITEDNTNSIAELEQEANVLYSSDNRVIDKEPDMFSFSVNGMSGRFFFGADGEWHVISDHNITVEFDVLDANNYTAPFIPTVPNYSAAQDDHYGFVIKGFTLIDDRGTRYSFGYDSESIEYSHSFWTQRYCSNIPIGLWTATSWYITKIEDIAGNELYNFNYERGYFTAELYRRYEYRQTECASLSDCSWGGSASANSGYEIQGQLLSPVYVTSVSSNTFDVLTFTYSDSDQRNFPWGADMQAYYNSYFNANTDYGNGPICGGGQHLPYLQEDGYYSYNYLAARSNPFAGLKWRKLDAITLLHNGAPSEKVEFLYTDVSNQRLKLNQINICPKLVACGTIGGPKYSFDYKDFHLLPGYLNTETDHWGYYNNTPIGNTTFTQSSDLMAFGNTYDSERDSDFTYLEIGSLQSITHPTKGITKFSYELHDYTQVLSEDRQSLNAETGLTGGLRIEKVETFDLDGTTLLDAKEYFYVKNYGTSGAISSGILSLKPKYSWDNWTNYSNFCSAGGYRYNVFSSNNLIPIGNYFESPIGYSEVTELRLDGSYSTYKYTSHETIKDDLPYTTLELNPSIYQDLGSKSYMRGKLTFEGKYDNAGVPVLETTLDYNDLSTSSHFAVVANAYAFQWCQPNQIQNVYQGSAYKMPYDKHFVTKRDVKQYFGSDVVTTTTDYTYTPYTASGITSDFRFLVSETMTNSDNTTYETSYQYPFNAIFNTSGQTGIMMSLVNEHRFGIPVRQLSKANGTLIDGTETTFGTFSSVHLPNAEYRYEYDTSTGIGSWEPQKTYLGYNTNWLKPTQFQIDGWLPTTLTYSDSGKLASWSYTANSITQSQSFTYDFDTDLLETFTDIDGTSTTYTYDQFNRIATITDDCRNVVTERFYHYANEPLPPGTGGTASQNFIKEITTYLVITGSGLSTLESFTYKDGIGRDIQLVRKNQSPDQSSDIVTATEYDLLNRPTKVFEPFTNTGSGSFTTNVTSPYTETLYYPDPLDRVQSITPPNWNTTTMQYAANKSADAVTGYSPNSLSKTISIDPNGNQSIVFTDKLGRQVLSRKSNSTDAAAQQLDTYTIYNEKHQVETILPPDASFGTPNLIFSYDYDARGNQILRKLPDSDPESFIYNDRELLVGFQNPTLQGQGNWMVSRHDEFGRIEEKGFGGTISDPNNPSITTPLEEYFYDGFDGMFSNTAPQYIGKVRKQRIKQLENNASNSTWIETTYNYDVCGRMEGTTGKNHFGSNESVTLTFDGNDNILTHTKSHTGPDGVYSCDKSFTYDHLGRSVNQFININGSGNEHLSRMGYSIKNEIDLLELGIHNSDVLAQMDYQYNDQGWLTQINAPLPGTLDDPPCIGSASSRTFPVPSDLFYLKLNYSSPYTALNTDSYSNGNITSMEWQTPMKQIKGYGFSYDYNDRLTKAVYGQRNQITFQKSDFFSTAYSYDKRGNIQTLMRNGRSAERDVNNCHNVEQIDDLVYTYSPQTNKMIKVEDSSPCPPKLVLPEIINSNRTFAADEIIVNQTEIDCRSEVHIYAATSMTINDALNFFGDCQNGGVTTIHNFCPTTGNPEGFAQNSVNGQYVYDGAGNIITDPNKNITIEYNHLNLPFRISTISGVPKELQIEYDAMGTKLSQSYYVDGVLESQRDYSSGVVYRNSIFESMQHEQGRAVKDGSGGFLYEYHLRDHLGNTRVRFADISGDHMIDPMESPGHPSELLSEQHYYPFGLIQKNVSSTYTELSNVTDDRYGYNGKELVSEMELNWMPYGYRNYDPTIGRFTGVDPISDQFAWLSTYNYAENKPTSNIDLHGLQGVDIRSDLYLANKMSEYNGRPANENFRSIRSAGSGSSKTPKGTLEGSLYSGSFDAQHEVAGVSGSLDVAKVKAYNESGGTAISIGASGSVIEAKGDLRFGTTDLAVVGHGEGSLLSANANADIGFLNNQNDQTGFVLDLNAGAYSLEGEVSTGFSFLGLEFTKTTGGSVGSAHIGLRIGAAYDHSNQNIVIEGLEHIGLGAGEKAGFKLSIPTFGIFESREDD